MDHSNDIAPGDGCNYTDNELILGGKLVAARRELARAAERIAELEAECAKNRQRIAQYKRNLKEVAQALPKPTPTA